MKYRTQLKTWIWQQVISRRWRMTLMRWYRSRTGFRTRLIKFKESRMTSRARTEHWREKSTSWIFNSAPTKCQASMDQRSMTLVFKSWEMILPGNKSRLVRHSESIRSCWRTHPRDSWSRRVKADNPPSEVEVLQEVPVLSKCWNLRVRSQKSRTCSRFSSTSRRATPLRASPMPSQESPLSTKCTVRTWMMPGRESILSQPSKTWGTRKSSRDTFNNRKSSSRKHRRNLPYASNNTNRTREESIPMTQ